jgi:hypothetical protein
LIVIADERRERVENVAAVSLTVALATGLISLADAAARPDARAPVPSQARVALILNRKPISVDIVLDQY